MKRYIPLLSILTATIFSNPCKAQRQRLNDSTVARLDKVITDFKDKYRSPGVSVCLVHENDIVYSTSPGYTNIEHKTPVSIDSKFPIMSVTKTFTATMLMQLNERGTVKLDDDVRKYIPEYKIPGTTLFQLATHSAGLPRNSPADVDFAVSFDRWMLTGGKDSMKWFSTNNELLHSLQFVKLDYPPFHYIHHNDRHYSNLGYSVLGIALERAAKTNFAAYVHNSICKPLGMLHSGFLDEPGAKGQVATGYRYNATTGATDPVPYFMPYSAIYAGGMYSTARDMSKFISAQFDNNNLLSPESKARMRFSKIGWKPAYPYVLHEGAIPGYRSIVVFNPENKAGWVILTNVADVDFNQVNGQIAEIVSAIYGKQPAPDIAKFVGTYKLPGGYSELKIFLKNDTLYSTYLDDLLPNKPMLPDGRLRFKVEGPNGHTIGYEFVTDDKNGIGALRLGQSVWYKQ